MDSGEKPTRRTGKRFSIATRHGEETIELWYQIANFGTEDDIESATTRKQPGDAPFNGR
jgi:hypothetical protein